MQSKILAIKETFNSKFWWDRFAWALVIFGFADYFIFKRTIGILIILTGIMILGLNYMKLKKIGFFKPKQESVLESIRKPQTKDWSSFGYCAMILVRVFVMVCFCTLLMIAGFKIWNWADQGLKKDCYQCSWFQKDCNQTKMIEQEYGPNNMCNDLGTYELVWKMGGMIGLMGLVFLFIFPGLELWQIWRIG